MPGGVLKWSVKPLRGEASYGEARVVELTAWTLRAQHTDEYGRPTSVATTSCARVRADVAAAPEFALFSLCRLKIAALFLLERDGAANRDGSMTGPTNASTEICTPSRR
jgi:hypothetical protein